MAEVSFNANNSTIIKLSDFNNEIDNNAIKAENEKSMKSSMAHLFTTQDSLNGFGTISVLNPHVFSGQNGSSYLEIVFDVIKDADDQNDYDFKVGFFYYGGATKKEIDKFNNR